MNLYDSNNVITVMNENHLFFNDNFNNPIDNLPKILLSKPTNIYLSSIKYITFGKIFNQSVNNLPDTILGIKFGHDFNQPVDKLPNNLIYLEFGENFYQSVNELPSTLETLIFFYEKNLYGYTFGLHPEMHKPAGTWNRSRIDNSQLILNLNNIYPEPVTVKDHTLNILPPYLKKLQLNEKYLKKEVGNLPIFLRELLIPEELKNMINKIPFDCDVLYI